MPTRKHIVPDEYTIALYQKVQKVAKKKPALRLPIFLNGLAKLAMQEFVRNHPELGVEE